MKNIDVSTPVMAFRRARTSFDGRAFAGQVSGAVQLM